MAESQQHLVIGVGVLRVLRDQNLRWEVMLREWIDNSLGARARNITIRRHKDSLEIIDDGDGCSDLFIMESPARSYRTSHNRASMYGIGGVMSQIHASQGGLVEVASVHCGIRSEISIDWNKCIESDSFGPETYMKVDVGPDDIPGTTIRIAQAKRFRDIDRIIIDLGHDYAEEIRRGRRITFDINGTTRDVEAYPPPPFEDRVDFDFDFQGHRIRGYCGVVKAGVINRYPGWSVHWGYRVAMVTKAPAGDHLVNRIYGEIYLPRNWKNIVPTKDDFTQDADELWEEIGRRCEAVIRRGDTQATDFELAETSEIVGDLLTEAIGGDRSLIKGRRPGRGDKQGTVDPTGDGPEHREFTTSQPGYKPSDQDGTRGMSRPPKRIRIAWDEAMEGAYRVDITGTRSRTMTITLNKGNPRIGEFREDASKLVTLCCGYVSHELVYNQEYRGMFPSIQSESFADCYNRLLERASGRPQVIARE